MEKYNSLPKNSIYNSLNNKILVFGAGGFAREVAWLIEDSNKLGQNYKLCCFIDDTQENYQKVINTVPVLNIKEAHAKYPDAKVVVAVGSPKLRQKLVQEAEKFSFKFETIIHPGVRCSRFIDIGEGTVIAAGNILTVNIELGKHVQINLDCTVGHDVMMGDYTTLAPGVHVSGRVHFGQRVYVGTGAAIINGLKDSPIVIGDDAVIGAGAVVTRSVFSGITVVGVPAKPLKK